MDLRPWRLLALAALAVGIGLALGPSAVASGGSEQEITAPSLPSAVFAFPIFAQPGQLVLLTGGASPGYYQWNGNLWVFVAPETALIDVGGVFYVWSSGGGTFVVATPPDTTPPSIAVSHTPDGLNGWNVTSPVTVGVDASDSGSGLAGPPNCTVDGSPATLDGGGGTWTLSVSGDGSHAVDCSVSDAAGNRASADDTVQIDTAPPVVSYSGNAGTYALTAAVAITCTASDPTPGSGLASPATCAGADGPAWTFGPGAHTLSATAGDVAGNQGGNSTTFTVVVDVSSLCSLTRAWSTNAGGANAACEQLGVGDNGARRPNISQYDKLVAAQSGKTLTAAQVAQLRAFAASLS